MKIEDLKAVAAAAANAINKAVNALADAWPDEDLPGTVVDGWYSAIWIVVVDASLPNGNVGFGGGHERPEICCEDAK